MPPSPDWTLTISQTGDDVQIEAEGDLPSFFTMYGVLMHTIMVDLPAMYDQEEEDAQG